MASIVKIIKPSQAEATESVSPAILAACEGQGPLSGIAAADKASVTANKTKAAAQSSHEFTIPER